MAKARDIMDPGLSAIALVIRAREGPRFVFHYPPQPSGKAVVREARFGTELDTEPISPILETGEDSDDSFDEDFGGPFPSEETFELGNVKRNPPGSGVMEEKEHYTNADGSHVAPWDNLWEFPTADLESILTPSRVFHKRKFELSLDPVNFISYPIHIRDDGVWKKRKVRKNKKKREGEGQGKEEVPVENGDAGREEEEDEGGMTMFNVVFMVNVPKEEEDARVQEIYEHVVKKFNKALKHAQASDNYVWKESEMILSMKDKAREESMLSYYPVSSIHILTKFQDDL
jgi:hypothetical protein